MILQAIVSVLAFIAIALSLTANPIQAQGNLKCLCDFCDNQNCVTDGFCYAYATWFLGNKEVRYSYRCIGRPAFIFGHSEDCQDIIKSDKFASKCCKDVHYCNQNLKPVFPLVQANSEVTSYASKLEETSLSFIKRFIYVTVIMSWIVSFWR